MKIKSFHCRAENTVYNCNQPNQGTVQSVFGAIKKQACTFVRKCLDGVMNESFDDYFTRIEHKSIRTRNNSKLLKLPPVRTEYGRRSLIFMGAKLYNELPLELRSIENFDTFKKELRLFHC